MSPNVIPQGQNSSGQSDSASQHRPKPAAQPFNYTQSLESGQLIFTDPATEAQLKQLRHPEVRMRAEPMEMDDMSEVGVPHPLEQDFATRGWLEDPLFRTWRGNPGMGDAARSQRYQLAIGRQDNWPALKPYETRSQFKVRQSRHQYNYTDAEIEEMFTWRLVNDPQLRALEDHLYLPVGMGYQASQAPHQNMPWDAESPFRPSGFTYQVTREGFPCTAPECLTTFQQRSSLNRHINRKHNTDTPQFQCGHCGDSMTRADNMRNHCRVQHDDLRGEEQFAKIEPSPSAN